MQRSRFNTNEFEFRQQLSDLNANDQLTPSFDYSALESNGLSKPECPSTKNYGAPNILSSALQYPALLPSLRRGTFEFNKAGIQPSCQNQEFFNNPEQDWALPSNDPLLDHFDLQDFQGLSDPCVLEPQVASQNQINSTLMTFQNAVACQSLLSGYNQKISQGSSNCANLGVLPPSGFDSNLLHSDRLISSQNFANDQAMWCMVDGIPSISSSIHPSDENSICAVDSINHHQQHQRQMQQQEEVHQSKKQEYMSANLNIGRNQESVAHNDQPVLPQNQIGISNKCSSKIQCCTGTFPQKVYRMLVNLQHQPDGTEYASFCPNGLAFAIHKPKEFAEYIMPKYFRMSKFSSFQRQLNMYGFEHIKDGPNKGSYRHDLFVEGQPMLCARINIKKKSSKRKK